MTPLEELTRLLGAPGFNNSDPAAWSTLEAYLGLELPSDYKAFLDAYGSGLIANTLTVTHPACVEDAIAHQTHLQENFVALYDEAMAFGAASDGQYPYPFHPVPGGLIYWGSGGPRNENEQFFLPGGPDPDSWKIVSLVRKKAAHIHDGSFVTFLVDLIKCWCTPLSEEEWAGLMPPQREWRLQETARGTFTPGFTPLW
jgi:hypothetical protein